MENDKQINDKQLEQVKNVFLSDELLVKNVKPEVYSLPDEFAKSKKNKNLIVFALIGLYITAIGVGVFFITTIEENKSKRVEVSIEEFRQFNLMELLAEQKENKEKLVQLQQEVDELRRNGLKEIQKLSRKDQQKATEALNEKIKKLEDAYNQQIASKEETLQALEKSLAIEKQRIAKNAQETQTQVKNYQNLNQLQGTELVRLTTEYEAKIAKLTADQQVEIERLKKDNQALADALILRYNPIYSQGDVAAAINSKLGNTASGTLNKFTRILPEEGLLTEQDFNQLRRKIQNQKIIINSLSEVPYTNSVPLALNRLDRLSQSIIGDYEALWGNLAVRVNEKNDFINSYEYAVNYLSTTRRERGYVIDARDPNRVIIFIDHIYSVKKGDIAYIFKNDDVAIAKIELYPEHGRVTAKIKELLKPIKIEPFDKILLKLEVAK